MIDGWIDVDDPDDEDVWDLFESYRGLELL